VNRPTRVLRFLRAFLLTNSFVLFFGYLMNSFACLCPGVLFQYEALVLASQAEIMDSSGPTRLIEAPALARKSAFSAPVSTIGRCIFDCLIQTMRIFFRLPSC